MHACFTSAFLCPRFEIGWKNVRSFERIFKCYLVWQQPKLWRLISHFSKIWKDTRQCTYFGFFDLHRRLQVSRHGSECQRMLTRSGDCFRALSARGQHKWWFLDLYKILTRFQLISVHLNIIPDIRHLFYTHTFWGLNILHSKVCKFMTKSPWDKRAYHTMSAKWHL